MRRYHWLRGNVYTKIPLAHLCVATQVQPLKADPTCYALTRAALGAAHWDKGRWVEQSIDSYTHAETFWSSVAYHVPERKCAWVWLLSPEQDLVALQFAGLVERHEWERKFWVWGDPPVILRGKLCGKQVCIIGIGNWLESIKGSLADLLPGDDLLLKPGDLERTDIPRPLLLDLRRCMRLVETILSFVRREDLGHLRTTIGGQSLQSYRHLHLHPKLLVHANPHALQLERDAALGHPIRCPRPGPVTGPIHVCDVNALYPYVMGAYPYPRRLEWYSEIDDILRLKHCAPHHLLIARVSGHDDAGDYLVKRAKLCGWDCTLIQDVLVGPDLDRALWRDKLTHVHAVAAYDAAPLFETWSTWAWTLRQATKARGDRIELAIAKALTVALWGKFAGRQEQWEEWPDPPERMAKYGYFVYSAPGQPTHYGRAIAGQVVRLVCHAEPHDSMPSISAFVACYARTYMSSVAAIVGKDELVYQCADEVHVTDAGLARLQAARLIDDDRYGALKIKRTVAQAYYHAPNLYVHDGEWTAAGRKVGAVQVAGNRWEWESQETLKQAIVRPPAGVVYTERHCATVDGGAPPSAAPPDGPGIPASGSGGGPPSVGTAAPSPP